MQTHKLAEERIIIEQYIQTTLQTCISSPKQDQIVRFPLRIYQWCTSLFKREKEVGNFILHYFIQNYYVKDISALASSLDDSHTPYFQMIKKSPSVVQYMSQIFIRVFILGLSIKLGEKQADAAKCKMRQLIKNLQIQMVLNSAESFSEFVIKELQLISDQFGCVQFYEELRFILAKCDTFQILEWIEKQMELRRQQFQRKLATPQQEVNIVKQKKIIKKRVTINNQSSSKEPIASTPLKNDVQPKISKSSLKEKTSQKQNEKAQKLSLALLAKKARESVGSNHKSLPKLPHRFIFRSTKKENRQQEEQSYESPVKEEGTFKEKVSLFMAKKEMDEQEECSSSRVLGCQTPPQVYVRNRRLTQ